MITTQKELRRAFWEAHPDLYKFYRRTYTQNDYNATVRVSWCDYVDCMNRNGEISDALAQRATL